jgi:dihydroflavonol-4-reductase
MAMDRRLAMGWPNETERPGPRLKTVLVTGAGGFVGGHIAREMASAGYRVKALTRRAAGEDPDDPRLEWVRGDLCSRRDLREAVEGVQGVVHSAGWVSLTIDRRGMAHRVNVEGTRALLDCCADAGVERFVYTSSLWTTAAGTADAPADEEDAWNLESVRSPYCESKRAAERLVLERNGAGLRTSVICPGMVVGPGDRRPTSTALLLSMARWPVVFLPAGGIPLVDVRVLAEAHRKILEGGTPGRRYVVVGPYLSYREIARWVHRYTGRPWWIVRIPDWCGPVLHRTMTVTSRVIGDLFGETSSAATIAGGFLRLHVSGTRADAEFQLTHPPASRSIFEALEDHARSGRAPWLAPLRPDHPG